MRETTCNHNKQTMDKWIKGQNMWTVINKQTIREKLYVNKYKWEDRQKCDHYAEFRQ